MNGLMMPQIGRKDRWTKASGGVILRHGQCSRCGFRDHGPDDNELLAGAIRRIISFPLFPAVVTNSCMELAHCHECRLTVRLDIDALIRTGRIHTRGRYRRRMTPISFKRHRFSPEIIQHAVWLYARFTLSFRDVEDLLAERGIDVSNETVRRWFLKFGRLISGNLRRSRPRASARWHLDEMVIRIRGRRHWLWRAVDDEGEVLDFLVQPRRCARSAQRLLRKLLKKQALRRSVLPRTSSNPTLLRSAKSDLPLFTIRDCGRTIEPRIHTSRYVDANENNSGSIHRDPPNGSFQSTPPSTTLSTSSAIFYPAAFSRRFEPRRSLSGIKAGVLPDPDHDPILRNATEPSARAP